MFRFVMVCGVIAGLIASVPMIAAIATGSSLPGLLFGYLTMLVALSAVFLGIKKYRDTELGGVIRFMPALLMGLAISVLASLIYAICWEAYLAISGYDFGAVYGKAMVEAARAKGATPAELQQLTAEAESFARSYRDPLVRFPMTFVEMFPVGVLVSIISAALLRNSRLLPARRIATE